MRECCPQRGPAWRLRVRGVEAQMQPHLVRPLSRRFHGYDGDTLARTKLMRTAPTASSRGTPIAASTCDGSTLPLWHAEPDEQATPDMSSASSIDSLSVPGTEMFRMCGARGAPAACTTASGIRVSSSCWS